MCGFFVEGFFRDGMRFDVEGLVMEEYWYVWEWLDCFVVRGVGILVWGIDGLWLV